MLRNGASAMHFFLARLLFIAVMTYAYVYHLIIIINLFINHVQVTKKSNTTQLENILAKWHTQGLKTAYVWPVKYKIHKR